MKARNTCYLLGSVSLFALLSGCGEYPEQPELQSYAINPLCVLGCSTNVINDSTSPNISSTTSRSVGP